MAFFDIFKKKDVVLKRDESLTKEQKIAKAMGCDIHNLSAVDNLALATILTIDKVKKIDGESFLCKTSLASCDSIIFACFIIRAMCIGAARNRQVAVSFDDRYMPEVKAGMKYVYKDTSKYFDKMYANRTSFYDTVFMSQRGIDNKINAIIEQFSYILQTDAVVNRYEPFSTTSPVPIMSIFDTIRCQQQAGKFFELLPDFVHPYFDQVQKSMM